MIKVRSVSAKAAEILIMDVIGKGFWDDEGVTANKVKEQLDALGDVEDITVRINSPGGNVWDGVAIYNLLKNHAAKVNVIIEALAASAASTIAMAGDSIVMNTGAMMMIHNPASLAWGSAAEMRKVADMLDLVRDELVTIYRTHSNLSEKELIAAMDVETWYNGAAAVLAGLAHESKGTEKDEPAEELAAAAQNWTPVLAHFKHVPGWFKPKNDKRTVTINSGLDQATLVAALRASEARNTVLTPTTDHHEQEPAAMNEEEKAKVAAETLAKDQSRRAAINTTFAPFLNIKDAAALKVRNDLLAACAADTTCSADDARIKLLDVIAKQNGSIDAIGGVVTVGVDARDKYKVGAEHAILARMGVEKREEGNEFNGKTLCDLAEIALRNAGISCLGLTKDGIARKVYATMTTSDFPQLMAATAGKMLRAAYDTFPATWQNWALKGQVSDFKIHPRIQLGSFNSLALIPEGGEYTAGAFTEEAENAQAQTKGKMLSLTRQMVVNDDLGGLQRRASLMGVAAARTVNVDAYAYLTSGAGNNGPTTADGGQYFNATVQALGTSGHGNLTTGPGTVIGTPSIAIGRNIMRTRRDRGFKDALNILPKILLTAVAREDLAWGILNSTTDVSQANPNKRNYSAEVARLDLITDPYLDGVNALGWYLMASPSDVAAAFEVVFLDGNDTPFLDESIDFMTDAMLFKIRLDYGVATGDWRGAYRNVGV